MVGNGLNILLFENLPLHLHPAREARSDDASAKIKMRCQACFRHEVSPGFSSARGMPRSVQNQLKNIARVHDFDTQVMPTFNNARSC